MRDADILKGEQHLPPANNSTTGSEEELNRLGFWLGAAAQSNTDQGPDVASPEADLATARHLGKRLAEVTLQFVRGRAALPRLRLVNASRYSGAQHPSSDHT
jgi:hypothetical protein